MPLLLFAIARKLLLLAPYFALGLVIEYFWPRPHASPRRQYRLNLTLTVVFWTVHLALGAAVMAWLTGVALRFPGAIYLVPGAGAGLLRTSAYVVVWIALRDGLYYAFHRWQHTSSWLWAEHAVHHSDEDMNVTTTWRHHWLEYMLQGVFVVAPFTALVRTTPAVAAIGFVVSEAWVHLIHCDARLGLGRWNWLLATPLSHRIHHSSDAVHVDRNFAALFPIWDVLFGTYHEPRVGEVPATGLRGHAQPFTLYEGLMFPFREWAQAIKQHRHGQPKSDPVIPA